jgi:hypothetical protein
MTMTKLPVQTVHVTFQKTIDWGGVPITVVSGDQSVHLGITNCWDPFPSMLRWLEAITTGVQCCFFDVDEEGKDKRFSLEQNCNCSWLSIINTFDESEIFIRAVVDPVQLVLAFYMGLKEYAHSPLYISEHWHGETLADRLASLTDPPRHETDVKSSLLFLNRERLRDALFIASPAYDIKFPGIVDEEEREHKELFFLFDPTGAKMLKGSKVKPAHWDIRKDFDQLSADEKSEYIDTLLGNLLDSSRGCNLTELKSPVIEKWLSERN